MSKLPEGMSFWVQCATVDHMVFVERLPPPTLVKIDVEGWEPFVLKGAQRLIRQSAPKAIAFEAEHASDLDILDRELTRLLHDFGYHIEHIPRRNEGLKPRENYLAVRK